MTKKTRRRPQKNIKKLKTTLKKLLKNRRRPQQKSKKSNQF